MTKSPPSGSFCQVRLARKTEKLEGEMRDARVKQVTGYAQVNLLLSDSKMGEREVKGKV